MAGGDGTGAGGHTAFSAGGQMRGSSTGAGTGTTATADGGAPAHPAGSAAAAAAARTIEDNGRNRDSKEKAVGWVFLEIVAALAIAVAIVWWTIPKKSRSGDAARDAKDDEQ